MEMFQWNNFPLALTLIGMSYESKKNAHLWCHIGAFFISLNELVILIRLMSIFTFKNVWKFLIKIQLTKSYPIRTKEENCTPSCQLGLSRELLGWTRSYVHTTVCRKDSETEISTFYKHFNQSKPRLIYNHIQNVGISVKLSFRQIVERKYNHA